MITIGAGSFWGCSQLSRITIPNSVTTIGSGAFKDCSSLTRIAIPSSVTTISDGYTFDGCSNISTILVESGNSIYDSHNNCNAIIEKSSNKLVVGCKSTIIPSDVKSIGRYAFSRRTDLTTISFPESLTDIEEYAFWACPDLKSIILPDSITNIGDCAFYSCELDTVTSMNLIPPVLGDQSFDYFYSSRYGLLRVPNTVVDDYKTAEGWKDFKRIEGLTKYFVVNGIYYVQNGENTVSVTYKDENYNSYSGDIIIPQLVTFEGITYQVTEIGENAFSFSRNLTSVSLPNSVIKIGDCAFQECSQLKSIVIPNSVEEIGNHAFDYAGLTNVN